MAQTVAARSLASLNNIADAPPLHPPMQLQGEEPLILYIARVPGSRGLKLSAPIENLKLTCDRCVSYYYEAKGEGCERA